MKRDNVATEILLRENIRHIIKIIKERNHNERVKDLKTEGLLRKVIRKMLQEKVAVPDEVPNRSTGINVLEELLKKIIPVLEIDFKSLTTDQEQRGSFRAHILNGIKKILSIGKTNAEAGTKIDEDIDIKVSDDDRFIDIEPEDELSPQEEFSAGLEDSVLDRTGGNVAFNSFKKIEQNILDSYDLLDNQKDQKIFYDYLLTNIKLYFDKFESEISGTVPDVTTPEYEDAQAEDAEQGTEIGAEETTEL
jgi:hypothetical protein